jgi:hypothetical protein
MGNFTQDAFWTEVPRRVRLEMTDHVHEALVASGMEATAIPWPSSDTDARAQPDLPLAGVTLVRRVIELARELRVACTVPQIPAELATRLAELCFAYDYVAQDLWNTVAGDRVWEGRLSVKELAAASKKLERLRGLRHQCNAIARERKPQVLTFDGRLLDGFVKQLVPLEAKLARALSGEPPPAKPAKAAPPERPAKAPASKKPAGKAAAAPSRRPPRDRG